MELTKTLSDMMRRDVYFRERMNDLGYVERPIVGIFDWVNETLETRFGKISFSEIDQDVLTLFKEANTKNTKRTPVTEDAVSYAKELVDNVPDFGTSKVVNPNYTRDVLRTIFLYEMLLMSELEDMVELSEDQKLHLVGSNQLTQGSKDTSERLRKEILSKQPAQNTNDGGLVL